MGVASREGLDCVVVLDASAFSLHRSCTKAGQHHFLFKRTVRGLDGEDLLVLVLVALVLQTEQSVQAWFQFFYKL